MYSKLLSLLDGIFHINHDAQNFFFVFFLWYFYFAIFKFYGRTSAYCDKNSEGVEVLKILFKMKAPPPLEKKQQQHANNRPIKKHYQCGTFGDSKRIICINNNKISQHLCLNLVALKFAMSLFWVKEITFHFNSHSLQLFIFHYAEYIVNVKKKW